MEQILEYTSFFFAAMALIGAIYNSNLTVWGFYIWLISNTFHASFNWYFGHWGYVAMDIGFILTNINGIYKYKRRAIDKTAKVN